MTCWSRREDITLQRGVGSSAGGGADAKKAPGEDTLAALPRRAIPRGENSSDSPGASVHVVEDSSEKLGCRTLVKPDCARRQDGANHAWPGPEEK